MTIRLNFVLMIVIALTGALPGSVANCRADDWPARTVKIIVPFSAGSANDTSARVYADGLARRWGRPVVIDNRAGADAIVGGGAFANAKDDHTLLFGTASMITVNPLLQETLPYDPAFDMAASFDNSISSVRTSPRQCFLSMAARLITTTARKKDISALRDFFKDFGKDRLPQDHVEEYSKANIAFHQALISLSESPILVDLTNDLLLHAKGR